MPEHTLTKYEAFLTNDWLFKWNKTLPHMAIVVQILTAIFLFISSMAIKHFFRIKTNQASNSRIKNTISFKRLNIIYGLGLLPPALLQAVIMRTVSQDTYVLHYSIPLAINSILVSLFVTDQEAMAFFKRKFQQFREGHSVNLQLQRGNNKVGSVPTEATDVPQEIIVVKAFSF